MALPREQHRSRKVEKGLVRLGGRTGLVLSATFAEPLRVVSASCHNARSYDGS